MRQLSPRGEIAIFRSLGISKIVNLALLTLTPSSALEEQNELQKIILYRNKPAKIKHYTICNNFTEGGLRNMDIKQNLDIKMFLDTKVIQ